MATAGTAFMKLLNLGYIDNVVLFYDFQRVRDEEWIRM